ncbi:hypothetical protein [Shimia sp. MIT1388]|uniref:hypothetical protein n=1 Tax=Shimia sp. MIT1388 TaxID=3096992 RepID=UPI00399B0F39
MERNGSRNRSTKLITMGLDPSYSRPLDVHVYSEHSEIGKTVEHIWQKSCLDLSPCRKPRGGARPKTNYRGQLRVLILDLYVAWKTDPKLSIGVHLSNTAWNTNSRYNAIGLSRIIPRLVHRLAKQGYIELSKGSFAGSGAKTNRTARIIAAEPLRKLFREAKFGREHIFVFPGKESVVLHDERKKEAEYQDTDFTKAIRADLKAYNELLARTFIDVPDQVETFIQRPIKSGPRQGELNRVPICGWDHHIRRIFNRSDWRSGGRFYGGWWQSVGSEFRKRIHLDDEPTVEVDYQALHVAILAAEKGVDLSGDPYELSEGLVPGLDAPSQRKLVKSLVLMALNARDRGTACKAFRQDAPAGSEEKSMTNKELLRVLDAFSEKQPFLADGLCSDQGIRLMNIDSRIASRVINYLTKRQIPVLCVHDSFLINYRHANMLKTVMRGACLFEVGRQVALSNNYQGLDEMERDSPELVADYIEFRHRDRCSEYRIRQRLFGERVSYLRSLGLGG